MKPEIDAPEELAHSAARSSRSRRKVRILLGVLGGVFLLVSIYALTDGPAPHDEKFLLKVAIVPAEDSVLAGLVELERALSEDLVWIVGDRWGELTKSDEMMRTAEVWGRGPIDPATVPLGLAAQLEEGFRQEEPALSKLDEILARPFLGSDPWVTDEDAPLPMGLKHLQDVLLGRAYLRRLQGDPAAASRDLDRKRRMAQRFLFEGANLFDMLPGKSSMMEVWNRSEGLLADGELDPEVEARWVSDRSVEEGLETLRVRLLGTIYTRFKSDLALAGEQGVELEEIPPWLITLFYKPNRTCSSLIGELDELLERSRSPIFEREEVALSASPGRSKLRMVLRANVGELLVPMAIDAYAPILDQLDELLLSERGGQMRLLLRSYERQHGELPTDLEAAGSALDAIDAVPIDPYSGKALNYDRTRRILWSVGPNFVDDEAAEDDVVWFVPPIS